MALLPRYLGYYGGDDCYQDAYGNVQCANSAWDRWIRWVVLAAVIVGALLIFLLFSCITARRRRAHGYDPYRGTGWTLGRTPPGHGAAEYNGGYANAPPLESQTAQPYYNNSNNPPPAYTAPPNTYELQPPGATYGNYRNDEQYAPPKEPPPGAKDYVVR